MKAIKLSLDSTDKINKKMSCEGFNGASWSDDDIASIHVFIVSRFLNPNTVECGMLNT